MRLFKRQDEAEAARPAASSAAVLFGKPAEPKVRPKLGYPLTLKWRTAFEEFAEQQKIFLAPPYTVRKVFKDGQELTFWAPALVEPYATLPRGHFCSMGAFSVSHSKLASTVRIGRYASIGHEVKIVAEAHPRDRVTTSSVTFGKDAERLLKQEFDVEFNRLPHEAHSAPSTIGNDVLIQDEVLIAGGVTIGDGAIVQTRAVVTEDVPAYAVVTGAPARVVGLRFDEAVVARLMAAQWWRYPFGALPRCWAEVPRFLDELDAKVAGGLAPWEIEPVELGAAFHAIARHIQSGDQSPYRVPLSNDLKDKIVPR